MKTLKWLLIACLCLALIAPATVSATGTEDVPLRQVSLISCRYLDELRDIENRGTNLAYQKFEKDLADLGIEVEYELIDNAVIADVIRTRMAAQVEIPDLICDAWTGLTQADVLAWINNGLIQDIKPLVEQYDEEDSIFTYYRENCPFALGTQTAADGGLYWFSYLNSPEYVYEDGSPFDYQGNPTTLGIRKDWLEKVGLAYKQSMSFDELFDALKAFQEQDVNGNGAKDEVVGLSINTFQNGIAKSFGLSTGLLGGINNESNAMASNFTSPKFNEYIDYMKNLYELGLYDTSALGSGMINQMIADNKVSLVNGYCRWPTDVAVIGDENAAYAAFLLNDGPLEDGFYASIDSLYSTYNRFMVTSACRDEEAVIDLYKYIYTDEYQILDFFGIEGYGFDYNEYGLPVLRVTGFDVWDGENLFSTVGLYCFPALNTGYTVFDRTAPLPEDPKSAVNFQFYNDFQNVFGQYGIKQWGSPFALPTLEEAERTGEVEGVLNTYAGELLTDLILGNRSLDDLEQYIAEMDSLGYGDYLAIKQAQYERYIAAMDAI